MNSSKCLKYDDMFTSQSIFTDFTTRFLLSCFTSGCIHSFDQQNFIRCLLLQILWHLLSYKVVQHPWRPETQLHIPCLSLAMFPVGILKPRPLNQQTLLGKKKKRKKNQEFSQNAEHMVTLYYAFHRSCIPDLHRHLNPQLMQTFKSLCKWKMD